jgi:hypothetical protein
MGSLTLAVDIAAWYKRRNHLPVGFLFCIAAWEETTWLTASMLVMGSAECLLELTRRGVWLQFRSAMVTVNRTQIGAASHLIARKVFVMGCWQEERVLDRSLKSVKTDSIMSVNKGRWALHETACLQLHSKLSCTQASIKNTRRWRVHLLFKKISVKRCKFTFQKNSCLFVKNVIQPSVQEVKYCIFRIVLLNGWMNSTHTMMPDTRAIK